MENQPIVFKAVATEAEIAETARLAAEIWHDCFAKILTPQQIDYMVEHIQSAGPMARHIQNEGYEYYLLYFGGASAPGGYLAVQAGGGKLLLSKFYFLSSYRGKGYGRLAMNFVEQLAREKGADGVWLTVNRHNERAIAVYRKTGFEQVRTQTVDIGGGYVMDDFVFEKPL